ncbi:MAG: EVE domain-containing protein [Acidimicrobiia bacterium]|nr:EVE domain-containing protein [Acidimicrobiia bacterium]MDH3397701.1 EVE domain-containing protein [Acidimicrobiia bacterium]
MSHVGERSDIGLERARRARRLCVPRPHPVRPKAKYFDARSDPDNPRWIMADMKFVEKLPRMVSLPELREYENLTEPAGHRRAVRVHPRWADESASRGISYCRWRAAP